MSGAGPIVPAANGLARPTRSCFVIDPELGRGSSNGRSVRRICLYWPSNEIIRPVMFSARANRPGMEIEWRGMYRQEPQRAILDWIDRIDLVVRGLPETVKPCYLEDIAARSWGDISLERLEFISSDARRVENDRLAAAVEAARTEIQRIQPKYADPPVDYSVDVRESLERFMRGIIEQIGGVLAVIRGPVRPMTPARRPHRDDYAASIVQSFPPGTPTQTICQALDNKEVPIVEEWTEECPGIRTWTAAYADNTLHSRVQTKISKLKSFSLSENRER
jgi:hypothetical protein